MARLDLVILELKNREMSRREFLGIVGFAFLAVIGLAPLLQMVAKRDYELSNAGAFGSADFGGEAAAARAVEQTTGSRLGGP